MRRFDPDRYYRATDPEMRLIGTPGSLANWRSEGAGPPFVKIGARVAYRGRDLNKWLDSRTVGACDD